MKVRKRNYGRDHMRPVLINYHKISIHSNVPKTTAKKNQWLNVPIINRKKNERNNESMKIHLCWKSMIRVIFSMNITYWFVCLLLTSYLMRISMELNLRSKIEFNLSECLFIENKIYGNRYIIQLNNHMCQIIIMIIQVKNR